MRRMNSILVSAAALAGLLAACTNTTTTPSGVGPRPDGGSPYPPNYNAYDAGGGAPPGSGITNPCGGVRALTATPGTDCGICGSGRWQCNGTDAVVCGGERREMQNACGGCIRLSAAPGAECNGGGRWQCSGRDNVVCSGGSGGTGGGGPDATTRNACGGTRRLEREVGSACGPCELGAWECDTPDSIICNGMPMEQDDISDSGWIDVSSTAPGYEDDYAVDGNRGTSWFSDGPSDGRATLEWKNLLPRCFSSVAILSNAENYDQNLRTNHGFGRVRAIVKDFWGFAIWQQEVSLAGTPDPDVYLDTGGAYGYSVKLELLDHEDPYMGGFGELIVTELQ